MSHFIGLCFGENWEDNLEQYNENIEITPYIEYTKQEAINKAKIEHTKLYNFAKTLSSEELSTPYYKYLKDVVNEYISDEEAWEIAKGWGYRIDSEENLLSTYNFNSTWDWYCIGGRWNGYLVLTERDENGDIIESNQAYKNEIDWDYMIEKRIPFCFVDEDGNWFEKGYTFDKQSEDDYKQAFKDYIDKLDIDILVTAVDFHI